MGRKNESFEKLFMCKKKDQFIYIQYLADDAEYVFDYTIYNNTFEEIDGGVIGEPGCGWDLLKAARNVIGVRNLSECNLDSYRKVGVDI